MHHMHQEARKIFAKRKAIITGDHFVYAKKPDGWYHGRDYVNKDGIFAFVQDVETLCGFIAMHVVAMGLEVDTVVGPSVGGALLAQWTARALMQIYQPPMEVISIFADEVDGQRVIKRGYDTYTKGRKCLLVEDVINSGLTLAKTRDAVINAGGTIVAAATLCNRSGGKVTASSLGLPSLFSLVDVDMEMFPEADCPICKERGVASVRTDLGKGLEFLARMA